MPLPDVRRLAVAAVLVAPFVAGTAVGAAAQRDGSRAFTFADPEVSESSGLVVLDSGEVVTTNDSGDGPRVFVVDPDSGETLRAPTWDGEPVDVEALASGGDDAVWVADIGDNRRVRDTVSLVRLPLDGDGGGPATSYDVRYPSGARDAEALVTHPLSGRPSIITKGVFAGEVHALPWPLVPDRDNVTTEVGRVTGIVTDATFLPAGGVVVVRTYARAVAYTHPGWQEVAAWELPDQQQGEGVAVDASGEEPVLLLSSEGIRAPVLREELPSEVLAADLTGSPLWQAWRGLPWVGWLAAGTGG